MNQGYDCECQVGFVGDGVTCRGIRMIRIQQYILRIHASCLLLANHAVSDAFIIGMSVIGVAIALVCFLSMITVGGMKIKRYCDHHNMRFKFRHTKNLK